jgi:hypothetical protein
MCNEAASLPPLAPLHPNPDSKSMDIDSRVTVTINHNQPGIGDKVALNGALRSWELSNVSAPVVCNTGLSSSNLGRVGTSNRTSACAASLELQSAASASTPATVTTAAHDSRDIARLIIPWSSLKLGNALGNGGFGTVYKGSWRGHKVAIKMLDRSSLSEAAHAALRHEALMMCRLRHPGIAQCYGLVDEDEHHALVMK